MLIFGRVHAAAQRVGHLPKLGFVADRCITRLLLLSRSFLCFSPSQIYFLPLRPNLGSADNTIKPKDVGPNSSSIRLKSQPFPAMELTILEATHTLLAQGGRRYKRMHVPLRLLRCRASSLTGPQNCQTENLRRRSLHHAPDLALWGRSCRFWWG